MLAYSPFTHSHHYHIDKCTGLDAVSQFGMTIHHISGNSNVIAVVLSCYPDIATVFGSVESSSLTWIREA